MGGCLQAQARRDRESDLSLVALSRVLSSIRTPDDDALLRAPRRTTSSSLSRYRSFSLSVTGRYAFGSLDGFFAGRPDVTRIMSGEASVDVAAARASAFVQDHWTPSAAVT